MSGSLGAIYVDLGLNSGRFTDGLNGAQTSLAAFGQSANSSLARASASFGQMDRAVGLSRLQLMELGHSARASFDIIASGGSPLRVLALEGARVAEALSMGRGGIGGAITGIGEAVMALTTPLNLAIAALAALGVGAVLWLTSEHDKTVDATAALEAHVQWIDKLLAGYDSAKKAADDYLQAASALPEAAVASDLASHQGGALDNLKTALDELKRYRDELTTDLSQGVQEFGSQGAADSVARLVDVVKQAGLASNSTKGQFDALVVSLTDIKNSGPPIEAFLSAKMLDLALNAEKAREAVGSLDVALNSLPNSIVVRLDVQMAAFAETRKKLLDLVPDTRDQFTRARDDAKIAHGQEVGAAPDKIMRTAADQDYAQTLAKIDAAEKAATDKKSGAHAESAAAAQAKKITSVTDALKAQIAALSMDGREQAQATALQQAGIAADDKRAAGLVELAGRLYDARQAQKALNDAVTGFQDIERSALSTFISDLENGKSAADALSDALKGVGDALLNAGINGLVGGQTTGLTGMFSSALHLNAKGGIAANGRPVPIFAGGGVSSQASIFGEAGPEAAVPLPDGRRIPVDLRMPSGAGGAITVHYAPQIDARGADSSAVAALAVAQARDRAEFESRVIGTIRSAKKRRAL